MAFAAGLFWDLGMFRAEDVEWYVYTDEGDIRGVDTRTKGIWGIYTGTEGRKWGIYTRTRGH